MKQRDCFDTDEKQPTHGPCPFCGASSMMHLTIAINGQLGRECACGHAFPIWLTTEQRPPEEAPR